MKMARILFAWCRLFRLRLLASCVCGSITARYVPHYLPYRLGWAYLTGAGQIAASRRLEFMFGVLPRIAAWAEAGQITVYTLLVWGGAIVAAPKHAIGVDAAFLFRGFSGRRRGSVCAECTAEDFHNNR